MEGGDTSKFYSAVLNIQYSNYHIHIAHIIRLHKMRNIVRKTGQHKQLNLGHYLMYVATFFRRAYNLRRT